MTKHNLIGYTLGTLLLVGSGCGEAPDDQPGSSPDALLEQELGDSEREAEVGNAGSEAEGANKGACGEPASTETWEDKKEPSPGNAESYGSKDPGVGDKAPNYCVHYSIGDGTSCIAYDDIKLKLTEACRAEGLELNELGLKGQESCGKAVYGASAAWASCCKPTPSPAEPCHSYYLGDGTTCVDHLSIKEEAIAACEAEKGGLTELWSENDGCEGGSARTKYTCCQPSSQVVVVEPKK